MIPRLLGKGKDRGKNTSDRIARTNYSKECRDWPAVIGQSQLEINLARCWHTFGGRRIESPQGGDTAGHPLLGKISTPKIEGRTINLSSKLELHSFSLKSKAVPAFFVPRGPKSQKKSSLEPPKSSFGTSKIEPGGLQDAIF